MSKPKFIRTPVGIIRYDNNFTDVHKNIVESVEFGAQVNTILGIKGSNEQEYRIGYIELNKDNIGLGKVDNTADKDKNVLSATKLTTGRKIKIHNQVIVFDGTKDIEYNSLDMGLLPLTGGTLTGALTGTTITANSFVGELTGNAATATKLKTARTITINKQSISFDGTKNITFDPVSMDLLALSGGTMTGAIIFNENGISNTKYISMNNLPASSYGLYMNAISGNGIYLNPKNSGNGINIVSDSNNNAMAIQLNVKNSYGINISNSSGATSIYSTGYNYLENLQVKTIEAIDGIYATALKTPINIKIHNQSISFDGSKDITFTASGMGLLPLTGGTLTGALTGTTITANTEFIGELKGNAATATKLATARTITINKQSISFDGTKDITFDPVSMDLLALSGGTMTGNIQIGTNAIYTNSGTTIGMKYGTKTINSTNRTGLIIGDTTTTGNSSYTIIGNNTYTMGWLNLGTSGTIASGITNAVTGGVVYNYLVSNYLPLTGGTLTGALTGTTITANSFVGELTGNAATATKLKTARTITINKQSISFDGTKDITFTASGMGLLPLTGGTLTGALTGTTITANSFVGELTGNAATATKLKTARTISLTGSVTGSGTFDGSGNLSISTTTNHNHDSTYLKLSGGTLTISSYYGLTIKRSDANGSAIAYSNSNGALGGAGFLSNGSFQISSGSNTNGNIMLANTSSAIFPGTVTATTFIGALSGNAATATKLATARTISLTGSVTGSGSFDGSGNLSIATTTNHTHSYLPLAGGSVTGDITFTGVTSTTYPAKSYGIYWSGSTDGASIYYRVDASDAGRLVLNLTDDANTFITFARNGTDFATIDTSGNYSGNAATATKLKTARTISLTGSVTGSGSFDGSGNLSITTTTNHTHNYAGSSSAGGAATTALACTGNAATASKLATARTITLSGSVTGSASFDGSGNITISTSTNHSHNYAGSSSAGGSANSAVKLDTATAGSATQPVYFSGGKPVACTYTLNKSVPSNAVFTDTNTWRPVVDNFTSTATDQSLSANRGRILYDSKSDFTEYSGFSAGDGSSHRYKIITIEINGGYNTYSLNFSLMSRNSGVRKRFTLIFSTGQDGKTTNDLNLIKHDTDNNALNAYVITDSDGTDHIDVYATVYSWDSVHLFRDKQYHISSHGISYPMTRDVSDPTTYKRKVSPTNGYSAAAYIADSATKATQDSDGNPINSTYLKLSGGTMTGNIQIGDNAIYANGGTAYGMKYGTKTIKGQDRTGIIVGDLSATGNGRYTIIGNDCFTNGWVVLGISGTIAVSDVNAVTGGVVYNYLTENYLPLSGGNVTGNITMGKNNVGASILPYTTGYGAIGSSSQTFNSSNIRYMYCRELQILNDNGTIGQIRYNASTAVMYKSVTDTENKIIGLDIYSNANIRLYTQGFIYMNGTSMVSANSFTWSDEKVKNFTDDIDDDKDELIKLFDIINLKSYHYKYNKSNSLALGFSAQDIEAACIEIGIDPEKYNILNIEYGHMMSRGADIEDSKYYTKFYSVSYNDLYNLSLLKIKSMEDEHIKRLDSLEERLSMLENK